MFRASQHPSSGVLKTVTAASGTGHNIGTATSLQRGPIFDLHIVASVGFLFTLLYNLIFLYYLFHKIFIFSKLSQYRTHLIHPELKN